VFQDVQYFNAKKLVIQTSLDEMEEKYQLKVLGTIDYLPTEDTMSWHFGQDNMELNANTSTVHVPTNIYDKCEFRLL
jgi:hypothetical protein